MLPCHLPARDGAVAQDTGLAGVRGVVGGPLVQGQPAAAAASAAAAAATAASAAAASGATAYAAGAVSGAGSGDLLVPVEPPLDVPHCLHHDPPGPAPLPQQRGDQGPAVPAAPLSELPVNLHLAPRLLEVVADLAEKMRKRMAMIISTGSLYKLSRINLV